MQKFDFSIHTRSGQKVESIVIAGRDRDDAERKLFQMYRNCTVVACGIKEPEDKPRQAASMEDLLTLISK
ncbi:hypothetical protein [Noviherbaspirillum sp. ST9]|uniref:hypothetical protein n=1 Tax=Noviherbaspirillum sp. ST9 TaxID=3401606 RepID=UPI003B58B170